MHPSRASIGDFLPLLKSRVKMRSRLEHAAPALFGPLKAAVNFFSAPADRPRTAGAFFFLQLSPHSAQQRLLHELIPTRRRPAGSAACAQWLTLIFIGK
jgi:hypothetical protein